MPTPAQIGALAAVAYFVANRPTAPPKGSSEQAEAAKAQKVQARAQGGFFPPSQLASIPTSGPFVPPPPLGVVAQNPTLLRLGMTPTPSSPTSHSQSQTVDSVAWTVSNIGDLAQLAAICIPTVLKMGGAQSLDKTDDAVIALLKSARWADYDVREQVRRDIASNLQKLNGLSNRGNPGWSPPGLSGPYILGPKDRYAYSEMSVYVGNSVFGKLPLNPQPYILEITSLLALDAGNKKLAKDVYGAAVDPIGVLKSILNSAMKNLGDQVGSKAQNSLVGKLPGMGDLASAGQGIIDQLVQALTLFLIDLIKKIEAELDRRKKELTVLRVVNAGCERLASQIGETARSPVGSLAGLQSQHPDKVFEPLNVWGQVADRDLHFLGGVYPGPGLFAYRSCCPQDFAITSRIEIPSSAREVENWLAQWKDYGIYVGGD